MASCQALAGAWALSVLKRTLGWLAMSVLSGAKLSVKWLASGQGLPNVVGVSRSSSRSTLSGRGRFMEDAFRTLGRWPITKGGVGTSCRHSPAPTAGDKNPSEGDFGRRTKRTDLSTRE